jgi:hypothetical protein
VGQSGGGATAPKRNKDGSADGARVLVKAATPARKASQSGSMDGITSGGDAATQWRGASVAFPSARRPGCPQRAGEACSHLGGHRT